MLLDILLLILGLFLVIKGGDLFVDESVHIARHFGVPRIVVGGTLVSLATTMPELVVSATASMMGDSGIALGNAVGSTVANIGLVAGIAALISGFRIEVRDFRIRSTWMLASAILVILFSLTLHVNRFYGYLLLGVSLCYLFMDYLRIKKARAQVPAKLDEKEGEPMQKSFVVFAFGAALVVVGSRLLVSSGIGIATALGIPSVVIGLTVIAVGTSLPELVTAISSARKGVADLAIGNVIGANVLNLAMITGTAAVIRPLVLTRFTQCYSFSWMMVFVVLIMAFLFQKGEMKRKQGVILVSLYAIYTLGLIILPMMGMR